MVYAEAKFQIRPAGHRLCTSPILCYGRKENFNVGKRYILPSGAMSTQGGPNALTMPRRTHREARASATTNNMRHQVMPLPRKEANRLMSWVSESVLML